MSLAALLLLMVWAIFGYDWRDAIQKFQLLQSVDLNRLDESGVLYLKTMPDEIAFSTQGTGCLALWQSRSIAAHDLDLAETALAQASGCSREDLVALWAGNLAWLQGNREEAVQDWSELAVVQRVALGRSYVLSGHAERGRAILESVADRGAETLPAMRAAQLHQTLGEVYESSGELARAAAQYRKAWDLGGNQYELAFLVGRAYHRLGRCGDAVDVLETGLETKPPLLRPQLDSAYYMELGQCYVSLGDEDLAKLNYLLAQDVLNLAQNQGPGAEFPVQQQAIEQLLHALEPVE